MDSFESLSDKNFMNFKHSFLNIYNLDKLIDSVEKMYKDPKNFSNEDHPDIIVKSNLDKRAGKEMEYMREFLMKYSA